MKKKPILPRQELQVEGMKILLEQYEKIVAGKPVNSMSCPLCRVVSSDCSQCAWGIIEGKRCEDFFYRFEFPPGTFLFQLRNDKVEESKIWAKARIPMLKRWIKMYEQ